MGKLSVSVAMTTYNGDKYLKEQLDSIKNQTYEICEVIICDDGSKDDTEQVVENYINSNNLSKHWRYYRNEENLGPMRNFAHCAKLCSGEIIFYSDQDDKWEITKVEEMIQVYKNHEEALAVCCGQQYMYKNEGVKRKRGKFISSGAVKKITFEEQVKTMYSSGLCLSFRRDLLDEIEYLVFDRNLTYDVTTGLVAALKGGMYRIERPLVHRRIHEMNASHPTVMLSDRINHYQLHIDGRKLQLHHLETILEEYNNLLSEIDRRHLVARTDSIRRSIDYLNEFRWWKLFWQIFSLNPMENRKLILANTFLAFTVKKKF